MSGDDTWLYGASASAGSAGSAILTSSAARRHCARVFIPGGGLVLHTEMSVDARGKLVVYVGPMFAGKTTALFRDAAAAPRACIVRSARDTRGPRVAPPPGAEVRVCDSLAAFAADAPPGAVFVDEGFLFDDLVAGADALVARGVDVTVATIQYDFLRRWFENVRELAARPAARVVVVAGTCATPGCGAPSVYTRRTAPAAGRVAIGDFYAPACARCWRAPPE